MTRTAPSYNRSHALIIGVNNYGMVSPLRYAVNDAEAIADVLRNKFTFDASDVRMLLNGDATRAAIHKAFLDFSVDSTHIDDRLIVFFAGHGHTERSRRGGEVGYLVPCDGDPSDLSTLIRWDTLTRDAELIEAKHVLFVMDACYGGLAIMRSLQPGASRFLKDMLQRFARQVLTAGKADEVVADLGGPRPDHSVFTGHFLEALDGAAEADGILTANGVMGYVHQQVGFDPNSQQTPHYGYLNGDGDFIFNPPDLDDLDTDDSKDQDTLIPIPGTDSSATASQTQSLVTRAKTLLANDEDRIKLHELVVQETRAVLAAISTDTFKVQGAWSEAEFAERVSKYNDATEDLRAIQMLLGFWGSELHHDIIALPSKRITEQVTLGSGLRVWLALRWYPVLVLTYSCGLGAIASQRYSNLCVLLHGALPDERERHATTTIVQSLFNDFPEIGDAFKTLPGHERQYVPVSEYLFKELQPLADDVLFLGAEYEQQFDRLEMLISLECAFLERGWGPIGRFGWKHSSRVSTSPVDTLINEAETAGNDWLPTKGGFFSGSIDKFKATVEKFKPGLDELPWR